MAMMVLFCSPDTLGPKWLHVKVHLLFNTQSQLLTTLGKIAFENIVEKRENAGNQHFLLYPQCFLLY